MSKYKVINTQFKNARSILNALEDLEIQPDVAEDVYQLTLHLFGYQGDLRAEKASIAVRRADVNKWSGGWSNDIGFAWNEEQQVFDAIVSEYDERNAGCTRLMNKIRQRYAYHEISEKAAERGYTIAAEQEVDGVIHLSFAKRY